MLKIDSLGSALSSPPSSEKIVTPVGLEEKMRIGCSSVSGISGRLFFED